MAAASSKAWLQLDHDTDNYRLFIDSIDEKRRALFRVEYRNNGSSFQHHERIQLPGGRHNHQAVEAMITATIEQLPRTISISHRVADLLPANFSELSLGSFDPNHYRKLLADRPVAWTEEEFRALTRSLIAGVTMHYRLRPNRWGISPGDHGIELLVTTKAARRIRSLDLRDTQLGLRGARALGCGAFRGLQSITLTRNDLNAEKLRYLLRKDFPNLGRLDVSYCKLNDKAIYVLSEQIHRMPLLDTLDLSENNLGPRGMLSILRATKGTVSDLSIGNYQGEWTPDLRDLIFGSNELSNLRRLNLHSCSVSEENLELLAENHPNLSWLEVSDNGLPAQSLERLKTGWFPNLDFLGFYNQPVRRTTLRRLRTVRSELQISYSEDMLV